MNLDDIFLLEIAGDKVDRENGVIKDVVILSGTSYYADKSIRRQYPASVLIAAVPLFEGVKVYDSHLRDVKVRRSRDTIGRFHNVRFEEGKIKGDLHVLKSLGWVFDIAEDMPEMAGLSIDARGKARKEGGVQIVESIVVVKSVDLVTDGATTKSLFESEIENKDVEGENDMDWSDITLDGLKQNAPGLLTQFTESLESVQKTKELEATNKQLQVKLDKMESEKALVESVAVRSTLVEKKLKDAKLPKEMASDFFLEQLKDAKDEETIDKLIKERKDIAGRIKTNPARSTASTEFTEGEKGAVKLDSLETILTS